jgi:hypothetical protein
MAEFTDRQELNDRLSLIETMIAEGRQTTEHWGWTFVLWGLAYYVAIAWSTWGHSNYAWPVTMIGTGLLTAIIASRRGSQKPETTISRSIGAIWIAVGISLFILCLSTALSGHAEQHVFLAMIEAMLGAANATSGIILKWKAQFACAIVWWAAAVASLFGTIDQSSLAFVIAIFLCQIVFGMYMAISEARDPQFKARKQGGSHA